MIDPSQLPHSALLCPLILGTGSEKCQCWGAENGGPCSPGHTSRIPFLRSWEARGMDFSPQGPRPSPLLRGCQANNNTASRARAGYSAGPTTPVCKAVHLPFEDLVPGLGVSGSAVVGSWGAGTLSLGGTWMSNLSPAEVTGLPEIQGTLYLWDPPTPAGPAAGGVSMSRCLPQTH